MKVLICLTVLLCDLFFVRAGLIGVLQSPLVVISSNITVEEKTYLKNAVNDTSPVVAIFTLTPADTALNSATPFVWKQNNTKVLTLSKDEKSDAYYTDNAGTSSRVITLHIVKNMLEYVGNISLTINLQDGSSETSMVTITSPPVISADDKVRRHLQGDSIRIRCPVLGYPLPAEVKWSRFPPNYTDDYIQFTSRINATTTPGSLTANDVLVIDSLEFADDGYIRCFVSTVNGNDTHVVELRVKDRLAALWPFIGIVIEVLILVTVILLYEKRRSRHFSANREETKEGVNGGYGQVATAPGPEGGDNDAETRQRAVKT